MKILNVAGARPNFMKVAPLMDEMGKHKEIEPALVHTGQHYDREMSDLFFHDLGLPEPDMYLGVGSGSHAEQTARIMTRFEKIVLEEEPDLVLVVGDVNSTLACSLVATKLHVPVAHVEAGLRSFNWEMPEEINRVLTDRIADYLFTTSRDANENLRKEGIPEGKIFFVGNVMIDTLLKHKGKAKNSRILEKINLKKREYVVLTMHRAENVDKKDVLGEILDAIEELQKHIKIVYPIHPRTEKMISEFGFKHKIDRMQGFIITEPMGYLDFLNLMVNSKFVLTDSGGIQEETAVLGIPCLTMRGETERPVTVTEGTNIVVGTDKKRIVEEAFKILNGMCKRGKTPELWDGKAAERIIKTIITKNSQNREMSLWD